MKQNGLFIITLLTLLVCSPVAGLAQAQDSIKTLTAVQVMQIVKQNHPVAKQALLQIEKAKADITIARARFDPYLYGHLSEKTFDGVNYYDYSHTKLGIPTWFGVELTAGIENLEGTRTNPEKTSGVSNYVGVSLPLAQNLLMDERRAALKSARIFAQSSGEQRRDMVNDLLFQAMSAYWLWVQHFEVYKVLDDALRANIERVRFVEQAYRLGERPAIDTTEAQTQLQSILVLFENARLQMENSRLRLSQYLWTKEAQPVSLPDDVIPGDPVTFRNASGEELPLLTNLLDAAATNHPELLLLNYKISALKIDQKLKFQKLLPVVNVHYNQLSKGSDLLKNTGPFLQNNYQYGVTMQLPLLLSEGRGAYRKARIALEQTSLERAASRLNIENKVRMQYNELLALKKQIKIQERVHEDFQRLQKAEELRFQIGESSLFLVNAREFKTLEALQKLQELRSKYLIAVNSIQWAAGLLVN